MANKKILLTAFRGTSTETLVADRNVQEQYEVLLLPNDMVKDSEFLVEALQQEKFDYVISLGQRPNIKDKVHIETTARKGELSIDTDFDCEGLKKWLEQNGLLSKISHNAGTSFCNELYWNGMKYLRDNNLDTQMVFMHVPFEKNTLDANLFGEKLFAGLEETINGRRVLMSLSISSRTVILRSLIK